MKNKNTTSREDLELETQCDTPQNIKCDILAKEELYKLSPILHQTYVRVAKKREKLYPTIEPTQYEILLENLSHDVYRELCKTECVYCLTDDLNEFSLESSTTIHGMIADVCDSCTTNEYLYMTYFNIDDKVHTIMRLYFSRETICEQCGTIGSYVIAGDICAIGMCLKCMNDDPHYILETKENVLNTMAHGYSFCDGIIEVNEHDSMLI